MKLCKVEGCNEKHRCKGYCNVHYLRMRDFGTVNLTSPDLLTRLESKIDWPLDLAECWPWLGRIGTNGYGIMSKDGRPMLVHRLMYELLTMEAIPPGLQIDHLCRNRECVNPAHLETVTARENQLRGESFSGVNARKTHCPKGHPYSGENLYVSPKGYRTCIVCRTQRKHEYRARQKLEPHAPVRNKP